MEGWTRQVASIVTNRLAVKQLRPGQYCFAKALAKHRLARGCPPMRVSTACFWRVNYFFGLASYSNFMEMMGHLLKPNRNRRLRDIFSVALFAGQLASFILYPTWQSLVFPVLIFGSLAAYFTMQDDGLFFIWGRHSSSVATTLMVVTFVVILMALTIEDATLRAATIILADTIAVYWMTSIFWLLRKMRSPK